MAVTEPKLLCRLATGLLTLVAGVSLAGVLPEDRLDALYHYYNGGGVEIDGPSILARKSIGQHVSVSGNYYVDTVSSASIDVLTTASPYEEERTEHSFGVDFLRGDTIMSLAVGESDEDDYQAETINVGIAQEIFGGLTTVTMGYGVGDDTVRRNGDPDFEDYVERQAYRLGISQILTRSLIVSLNYEVISDEGFLNNPYRSVRYRDPNSGTGYSFQPEVYPRTRTSNAVAIRGRYFLPYRAAVHLGYRYFTDDWDIAAHTGEVGYTHPLGAFNLDLQYRYYTQTKADFYSDLYPYQDAQNFLARDKELSTFQSHTIRFGVSYDFLENGWTFLERGAISAFYDHIMFNYDDFRDLTSDELVGQEPLYSFDADVIQLFISFWF
ncbi:MAG: DUF3570 domain-containing protein [Gammaproteobacteria bacterium]|nr:DUF3570 domain-containing protein [Gammaproteobacteria bacterium]